MNQLNFGFKGPRRVLTEPMAQTSLEALKVVPAAKERQRVLDLITRLGWYGATADEIEAMRGVGRGHQRFAELRRQGKIVWNGQTRATRAGRQARVYMAV